MVIFTFVVNKTFFVRSAGSNQLKDFKKIVNEVNLAVCVCNKRGSKSVNYLWKLGVVSFHTCEEKVGI